jgi:AcrR family transcriptional regulator
MARVRLSPPCGRRGKGRPVSGERAVGREALIDAARALLMRLPPGRVTFAAVAREAHVDPALVRYYFKDRITLLIAVANAMFPSASEAAMDFWPAGTTPAEALHNQALNLFHFNYVNPFLHRLMLDEFANSASHEARALLVKLNETSLSRYRRIFEEGAKRGELKSIDPLFMHLALLGLCEFFIAAQPIIECILGKKADSKALAERYARFIAEMVVEGVKKR